MMKWKVVKNPRSSSADRSLECLKNDVQQSQNNVNNNNTNHSNSNGTKSNNSNNNNTNNGSNDTNNNVGEENKQDNFVKETNRQRESSLSRKPSIVATECINLKSILGLTRQRSETNLSNLGLISTEPRRSRSEVRGVSCDRLTVGYHTAPGIPLENGKTRSSSPPSRAGWLRGRKREREFRSPVKNSPQDVFGKTVVTGSNRKRTNSKSRNGDCRTIVDGSDGKQKNKVCPRSSLEPRKCKSGRKSSEEDIIEEEIYTEISNETNMRGKLLDENRDVLFKDPNKVIRKKGMAPKPQIATALFKEATTNGDVNLNPNSRKSVNEVPQPPPNHKLPRKNQTYNGRNQDKRPENRMMQTVKLNNLKNVEKSLMKTKNVNSQSVVAVAEIHKEMTSTASLNNVHKNKIIVPEIESIKVTDVNKPDKLVPNKESPSDKNGHEREEEQLPFHIDTPDYSTLDSVNCNSFSMSTEDITFSKDDTTFSKEDVANCFNNNNTDCDESLHESSPLTSSESCAKVNREISLSSILRDSSNDNKETEPTKKTVRFEKLDLIEKYKKSKTENSMDVEEDGDTSISENNFLVKKVLDVNSNEISSEDHQSTTTTTLDELSQCPEKPTVEPRMKSNCTNSMTVNVLVRNPSPAPQVDGQNNEDSSTQFVVKKSFVLTVAKQEKGFRSLCANKKPEVIIPEVGSKIDQQQQQISVTFLCSGPPSEGWVLPSVEDHQRLRSTSVPPRSLQQPVELLRDLPALRGRSRERRSKERQHCRKSHKARKKETVFAMPQAVIDELSQVLEKRKPSLDEIMVHP